MKSIDERGREFSAKWLEQSLEQVSYDGYCSGAVEEHKLIVEKLTKWLKENNGKRFYPYKDRENGKITWYLNSVFETLEGARHWCERRNLNLKWY